jgi:HEAT repeat protein
MEVPAMPLFGPPDIQQMAAKRDVQGLIKALSFKDAAIRTAAADALAPIKDPLAVEPLVGLLADDDANVRRAAIRALAARGGSHVVEPLVASLDDRDAEARNAAAQAVYKRLLTDPDQDTRRTTVNALGRIRALDGVEPLVKSMMDADETVRVAAVKALQAIGEPSAVSSMIVVLAHEQARSKATGRSSLAVERAIGQALDVLCDARAVPALQAAMGHDDAEVREIAVKRLARIASPDVTDALVSRLGDDDPSIRRASARGLQELGWMPPKNQTGAYFWVALREWRRAADAGKDAIPLLVSSYERADALEQVDILAALAQVGWEPAEGDAMAAPFWAAKGDWDKCVALGPVGIEALDAILRTAPSWRQRVAAADAMVKAGEARPYPFLNLELVKKGLEIIDGTGKDEEKEAALEALMAAEKVYNPKAGDTIDWCKCLYPSMKVKADGLREPVKEMLGFEQTTAKSVTYYCPSCDARRTTVAV